MEFNPDSPAPARPAEGRRPIGLATATVLTIGFELVAAAALVVAFYTSLCSLFGETCTSAEQTRINALTGTGLALGVAGPILVAWLRQAAVWALTPLILAGAGLVLWLVDVVLDL